MTCLNCDFTFEDTAKFCPHCGQKAATTRINARHIAAELTHAFTHADKGVFFLIKSLAISPGRVASEYVAGKRKKYFSPFNFLLLSAAVFAFFTIHFNVLDPFENNPVSRFLAHYSNFILILGAPILSFFSWLFFKRSGYNFSEALVLNAFLIGEINLFYDLIVSPLILAFRSHYQLLLYVYLLAWTAYYCWASTVFYRQKSIVGVLKAIAIIFLYQFFVGFIAYLVYYLLTAHGH